MGVAEEVIQLGMREAWAEGCGFHPESSGQRKGALSRGVLALIRVELIVAPGWGVQGPLGSGQPPRAAGQSRVPPLAGVVSDQCGYSLLVTGLFLTMTLSRVHHIAPEGWQNISYLWSLESYEEVRWGN